MVRQPAVAGQFYPITKESLEKQLSQLIEIRQNRLKAKGSVLPHAGYIYSGKVAASVIGQIAPYTTYIIIGPNHTGFGKTFSLFPAGVWHTPLGDIEIDADFVSTLLKKSSLLEEDIQAHTYEHSVEVELPFLQYVNDNFKLVSIVLGPSTLENYKKLGEDIAKGISETKNLNIHIIASSDFTHYESYESANKKDKLAIEAILKLDADLLWEVIKKEDISMCGYAPCIAMLTAAKRLGAENGKLTAYATSADATKDKSSVVGYAGIIVN